MRVSHSIVRGQGLLCKHAYFVQPLEQHRKCLPFKKQCNITNVSVHLANLPPQSSSKFKAALRRGEPRIGLFVNSASALVAEQLAFSGYDWLLVDTQHAPFSYESLGHMLATASSGGALPFVRVTGPNDTGGIQQACSDYSSTGTAF